MQKYAPFLAPDLLQALQDDRSLPDTLEGAVLLADISGFTALTERLARELGLRRGAEELSQLLNSTYEGLIAAVTQYGGNVIFFSGDAITCWYEGSTDRASRGAVASGLAMQSFMQQRAASQSIESALAVKVAIAAGRVRRFRVGDPAIQCLDVLAGAPLERMASAEHLTGRGEIVVSREVAEGLQDGLIIEGWRETDYAVITGLNPLPASLPPTSATANPAPDFAATLESWILPPVRERIKVGLDNFLNELRPSIALFLMFDSPDYDHDPTAGDKLNAYISRVQQILAGYDGTLLQLTIGDKGSYLYGAFGSPVAHQDDEERGLRAALDLMTATSDFEWLAPPRIGLSRGTMLAGVYGSSSRHTYGVLGDHVNLAARLMQLAEPGQILVSAALQQVVSSSFSWEARPPVSVSGKTEPVGIFSLVAAPTIAFELIEPLYRAPLVGRQIELDLVEQRLSQAVAGAGQVITIGGEAGVGKSHLLAEVLRRSVGLGLTALGGACQDFGGNSPWQVWLTVWRKFFDLDFKATTKQAETQISTVLNELNPALLPRLPLLGPVLGLNLPDNDLTTLLEDETRQQSLHSLLIECLKLRAQTGPLLIVLEDCHKLDPLSGELVTQLSTALPDNPIALILTYRNTELEQSQMVTLPDLPHITTLTLQNFSSDEVGQWLARKLAQSGPPTRLVEQLLERTDGNPFFIEELFQYLAERGIELNADYVKSGKALPTDLPDSLQSLILSRLDRLSEIEKGVVKVASVIGRVFTAAWIWGAYPTIGTDNQVKSNLAHLDEQQITLFRRAEPELEYIFKHNITQEVAYELLPARQQQQLHHAIASYLEQRYADEQDRWLDRLAFHYGRSADQAKQHEYFSRAGIAAQAVYANQAALEYYQKLLPLLTEPNERLDIWVRQGMVLELVGRWQEAEQIYRQRLDELADPDNELAGWRLQLRLGRLLANQGHYKAAAQYLEAAANGFQTGSYNAELAEIALVRGVTKIRQAEFPAAQGLFGQSLELYRAVEDRAGQRKAQLWLGRVLHEQGQYEAAKIIFLEGLELAQADNDYRSRAELLHRLGFIAEAQGIYRAANDFYEQAMQIYREIGDRVSMALLLDNLGKVAFGQGEYQLAGDYYAECLNINREIGDLRTEAVALKGLGEVAELTGDFELAATHYQASLALAQRLDDKLGVATLLNNLASITLENGDFVQTVAYLNQSLETLRQLGHQQGVNVLQCNLGIVYLDMGRYEEAWDMCRAGIELSAALHSNYTSLLGLVLLADLLTTQQNATAVRQIIAIIDSIVASNGAALEPGIQQHYETARKWLNSADPGFDPTNSSSTPPIELEDALALARHYLAQPFSPSSSNSPTLASTS